MEPMGIRQQAETVFRRLGEEVERLNKSKGWYDEERNFATDIALLHSEVSEALDAYRKWGLDNGNDHIATIAGPVSETLPQAKPEGVASELADVLIRLLDTCSRHDIDLVKAYDEKMRFNWTRPYRHGGKRV